MFSAEDVIRIYELLTGHDIRVWLLGGWGIDALLQEQTRPHKDLDILVLLDDVSRLRELLDYHGYTLSYLWSENQWAPDSLGVMVATAFVVADGEGREIDLHAMRLGDQENGVPLWTVPDGLIFPAQGLAGEGIIAGHAVRCLSAEMQASCHRGYDLPEAHRKDLELVQRRFGVEDPNGGALDR